MALPPIAAKTYSPKTGGALPLPSKGAPIGWMSNFELTLQTARGSGDELDAELEEERFLEQMRQHLLATARDPASHRGFTVGHKYCGGERAAGTRAGTRSGRKGGYPSGSVTHRVQPMRRPQHPCSDREVAIPCRIVSWPSCGSAVARSRAVRQQQRWRQPCQCAASSRRRARRSRSQRRRKGHSSASRAVAAAALRSAFG